MDDDELIALMTAACEEALLELTELRPNNTYEKTVMALRSAIQRGQAHGRRPAKV